MKRKRLEIVDGDGSNIEMSQVHVHINSMKPQSNSKKSKVIIPKEKKNK